MLVIAEPGATAEGDYATMVRLLKTAAACGANVWKPQFTSNPARMCERRKAPDYQRYYEWLAWPVEWHAEFRDRCHALGMQYACSVYLPEDVDAVAPFVDYLKISSFEANDQQLVQAALQRPTQVIISTGMDGVASMVAINLHCVSAYPAPPEEMNLRVLHESWCAGLSDHSRDVDMGYAAVCAGASIIEAHYRLYDCSPDNPDYAVAFDPGEFTMYINRVRRAERIMGDGLKRLMPSEQAMLAYKVIA